MTHDRHQHSRRADGPLVSAIIGTRGRPRLVLQAIDSVLGQTFADLELIVVVDGPDPETEAALATVRDPRVRVIVNPRNIGCAASRMVGVEAAKGLWVAFLDDDDEWLPTKLEAQVAEAMRDPPSERNNVIVTCLLHIVSPLGDTIRPKVPYDGRQPFDVWLFDRTKIANGSAFQASSIFASTSLVRELGFRPQSAHEDWDFVLRAIAERNVRLVTVRQPLVRYYRDDGTPRMSNDHKITESLDWLDGLGNAVSRRGYAAFCLTVMAAQAADKRRFSWFWPLLVRAMRKGRPTIAQLAGFFALWLVGKPARRRALGMLVDGRTPARSTRGEAISMPGR